MVVPHWNDTEGLTNWFIEIPLFISKHIDCDLEAKRQHACRSAKQDNVVNNNDSKKKLWTLNMCVPKGVSRYVVWTLRHFISIYWFTNPRHNRLPLQRWQHSLLQWLIIVLNIVPINFIVFFFFSFIFLEVVIKKNLNAVKPHLTRLQYNNTGCRLVH